MQEANWGVLPWMAVFLGLIILYAGHDIWFRKRKPCSCKCCKSCEVAPVPCEPPPHPRKRLKLKAFFHNSLTFISVQGYDMSFVARNDQRVTFSPVFEDAHGNPAVPDGKPVWSISDENVASLEVSEDGLTAVVSGKGPTGPVQVNLLIDADPGMGVEPLVALADITFVGGKITVVRLSGVVTDQPVVTTPELPVDPQPEPEPEVPPVDPVPEEPTPVEPTEPAPVEPAPEAPPAEEAPKQE